MYIGQVRLILRVLTRSAIHKRVGRSNPGCQTTQSNESIFNVPSGYRCSYQANRTPASSTDYPGLSVDHWLGP